MVFIYKIRNSKSKIVRDFDNGNEFHETLNDLDKEKYWKEDTKNLNIFFIILLISIEMTLYLLYKVDGVLWFLSLVSGGYYFIDCRNSIKH